MLEWMASDFSMPRWLGLLVMFILAISLPRHISEFIRRIRRAKKGPKA